MTIIYKGKGILVPLFLIISILTTTMLSGTILRYFESAEAAENNFKFILAIGFIFASMWTWYAKDTYIIKDGKKVIIEEEVNSFFFLKMKYWAHLFFMVGISLIIYELIYHIY